MEIEVLIYPSGDFKVKTVSILEDMWHDYEFFKSQAADLEKRPATPDEMFLVKRYQRAAVLMLVFYFEGVVNHWLKHLLGEPGWLAVERKPLEKKVQCIEESLTPQASTSVDISEAKSIRNALAHLKPGGDLKLFEAVTENLLAESEKAIVSWLLEMEKRIGKERHPDTREASRPLREALGVSLPESEGYSGTQQKHNKAPKLTDLQGQYLAFLDTYTKVNGRPPAEADFQRYFKVTPPAVHQMILTLARLGFITRFPGQARSIRLNIPAEEIPRLE